jgi:hypothetical protein
MIKSKTITNHKQLKDVHEESLQNPRQKQPVPVQPSGRAFECVQTPRSVLQINIEDVRTLGQSIFNKESIFRNRHYLGSLCEPSGRRGNMSGRCPIVQNIP